MVGKETSPSHLGLKLSSAVTFQLFFKTKTYKMTRVVQVCVGTLEEVLVQEGRNRAGPTPLRPCPIFT